MHGSAGLLEGFRAGGGLLAVTGGLAVPSNCIIPVGIATGSVLAAAVAVTKANLCGTFLSSPNIVPRVARAWLGWTTAWAAHSTALMALLYDVDGSGSSP
ncbi:hypothetical protein [Embleya sp. NPDC020630]|uniref:hypothetical protein n=1 Tax=Embleya sp. NPDC020630 TaxID=3363979 RepID=UPI003787CFBB